MKQNIDIFRWLFRRNVLQTKFQSASLKIDHQRPVIVAVTIAANKCERRAEGADFIEDVFRADIAQVPNLIRAFGQDRDVPWQAIVCISDDEYAQRLCHLR